MSNDITDLRFFVAVTEGGSLAGAARQMDVTASAVSQRLRQLETRLGLQLEVAGQGARRAVSWRASTSAASSQPTATPSVRRSVVARIPSTRKGFSENRRIKPDEPERLIYLRSYLC